VGIANDAGTEGRRVNHITVEVSRRPLHDRERAILLPDLNQRGIATGMLDVLPPDGRFFQLLRAHDQNGDLRGVTSLMSFRPFVSIKQYLAEGNHVGWDTSMYYAPPGSKPTHCADVHRSVPLIGARQGRPIQHR